MEVLESQLTSTRGSELWNGDGASSTKYWYRQYLYIGCMDWNSNCWGIKIRKEQWCWISANHCGFDVEHDRYDWHRLKSEMTTICSFNWLIHFMHM